MSHCHQGVEPGRAGTSPGIELLSSPEESFYKLLLECIHSCSTKSGMQNDGKLTFPKAAQESLLNAVGVVAKALEPPEANPEELNVLKA